MDQLFWFANCSVFQYASYKSGKLTSRTFHENVLEMNIVRNLIEITAGKVRLVINSRILAHFPFLVHSNVIR